MRMRTTRRDFVKTSLAACVSGFAAGPLAQSRPPSIKKGLVFAMVPSNLSYADRFKLVRDTGFQAVPPLTEPDEGKAEAMKQAAGAANIRIATGMNGDHWRYPLSASDPAGVGKSLRCMRVSPP